MKTLLSMLSVTLISTAIMSSAASADEVAQTRQAQTRVQQQQQWVNPNPYPAPKMGFTGQMIPGFGMKVLSVNPGTAAQRAGLEPGDVVMRINGQSIKSQWDYNQAMRGAAHYQGGSLRLYVRNIRFDQGYNVPQFVTTHTSLYAHGVPASGPVVAAMQR